MLHHHLTLDQLKQSLRTELCVDCPYRVERPDAGGPGKPLPCEAKCPVFTHLPALQAVGERLDPMLASHERAMDSTIARILENEEAAPADRKSGKLDRLQYHRRRLARVLGRLLNP